MKYIVQCIFLTLTNKIYNTNCLKNKVIYLYYNTDHQVVQTDIKFLKA